jgi:hypothetical protein
MKGKVKSKVKATGKTVNKKKSFKDKNTRVWRNVALGLLAVVVFNKFFAVSLVPKFDSPWSFLDVRDSKEETSGVSEENDISGLQAEVLPAEGVELPIKWGNFGKRMITDGVIDEQQFRDLFTNGFSAEEEQILAGEWDGKLVLNQQNSHFLLNMLWAFGLANDNAILTEGEMTDEAYGGDASNFASTGGWTLAKGDVMNHYSTHAYVSLTQKQQALVDRVSSGIFRPCCGNSTHFPDCNHGMAMLGLLELMAVNNVSEQQMYDVALKVNSFWFPQTYIELATYFEEQGKEWGDVDSKLVLSSEYSSGQGYQTTRQKIKSLPPQPQGGGGCGV